MLFDTHAHYDSRQFDADRDQVLSALPGQGVGLVVNPGCDLDSSRQAIGIAERYPFVYAAVGVHPEDCAGWQDTDVDELRSLAAHPKVVAIGEIGLDYYRKENPPREYQQGWMISFTGALTYKNARKAVEAAQAVPLDRIMIETDSPYMAPVPCRGERCHSGLARHTCQRLAELRGISPEECAKITMENGKRFFSIR